MAGRSTSPDAPCFCGDPDAWWIPAYEENRYEYLYEKSSIRTLSRSQSVQAVHTPLTMETADGLFLSIHEANLTDYASMTLVASSHDTLLCDLVTWSDGVKVRASAPHQTPWRTIQIAESAGDLITSYPTSYGGRNKPYSALPALKGLLFA